MSKKHKVILIIVMIIAVAVAGLAYFIHNYYFDISELDEMDVNKEHIAEDVYYEWFDYDDKSIFHCENIYIPDSEREYIEKESCIIKYAFDGKETIACHASKLIDADDENPPVNSRFHGASYYEIKKDYFVAYNIKTKQRKEFGKQNEFVDYCRENDLSFLTFKYTHGLNYNLTSISNSVELITFESVSMPNQLMIDGNILFEGFIWDCRMISNDTVAFKIKIPQRAVWEFPLESNIGINLSSEAVDTQQIGPLFIKENIYFKGTVQYNIKTRELIATPVE